MARVDRPTRVANAGFGTVGRSVARRLQDLSPPELRLTAILNRGIERKRVDWVDPSVRWTESIDDALADDVDVFVELIGGRSPAECWILKALQAGKSIVTANKQVIAHRGPELLAEAESGGGARARRWKGAPRSGAAERERVGWGPTRSE